MGLEWAFCCSVNGGRSNKWVLPTPQIIYADVITLKNCDFTKNEFVGTILLRLQRRKNSENFNYFNSVFFPLAYQI